MALSIAVPLLVAVLCWPPRHAGMPAEPGLGVLWQAASSAPPTPVDQETTLSVASAIDLLALALTSGSPLTNALAAVADQSGPVVAAQLRQVIAALQWGVDDAKAWQGLAPVWRPAADALALAARVGMPAAGLLREAAATIRRDERQSLQERTARLGVLIVLPLGGCFLPAFATLTVLPVVAVIARNVLSGT